MKTASIPPALVLFSIFSLGCVRSADESLYPSVPSLAIQARSSCDGGALMLLFTVKNVGNDAIIISNGVLPWDTSEIGTSFSAFSSGAQLKREGAYPTVGRTGPVVLGSEEVLSGEISLDLMFPELRPRRKHHPVLVEWKYWITRRDHVAGRWAVGTVPIEKGYCLVDSL